MRPEDACVTRGAVCDSPIFNDWRTDFLKVKNAHKYHIIRFLPGIDEGVI